MKKHLLLASLFLCIFFVNAQETMYIMKGGNVIGQHNINTEVDSIIFYTPSSDPVAVSDIVLTKNSATVFVGQTIDLTSYISSINPNNATNKSVTWTSNNESAVSITNPSSSAVALAQGSATLTVTANDSSNASASITITVSAEQPNTYYQGAIPNAKYVGRWKKEGGYDVSGYNGAYIKVNFTGQNATLNLSEGWSPTSDIFWRIDGGTWQLRSSVRVSLNLTENLTLSSGEHTLEIAAGARDTQPTHKILAGTLKLDPGAETLPPSNFSNKHIDFIGDSISTICYEDDTPDEHWNWLIGEQLGWEHAHIAMPSMTTAFMADAYANYFYSKTGTWDFATAYKTHAIVMNLGQNDGGKPTVAVYRAAIELIRSKQPNIPIICIGLFWDLGNNADVNIETAVNEVRAAGDTHVYYLGDAVGLSASLHPQDGEHKVIADALTPKIQEILNLYY